MNEGYTQANTKKKEVAKKMIMGETMHGDKTGYGGGMKYRGTGKNSTKGGGMGYKTNGEGTGAGKGMKPDQANKKGKFTSDSIYSQNGKAC